MVEIIPLSVWYPSMHTKWQDRLAELEAAGVKTIYPLSERDGWVIHHSVGGAATAPLAYARQVADMHWNLWKRPGGYNFLQATDGDLYEMSGFLHSGAHAGTSAWNRATLGLCFQGDYRTVAPADVMVESAGQLIHSTAIPTTQWTHRAVRPEPTTCPGSKLEALLPLEDDMPLTDTEMNQIAEKVWFFLITDPTTGTKRGAAHHLAQAYRYAYQASSGGLSAQAVADAISDDIAKDVVDLLAERLA